MSAITLAAGRRLLVCDVCLAYVEEHEHPASWQRQTPGTLGGADRCPDCAVPAGHGRVSPEAIACRYAELIERVGAGPDGITSIAV